MIPPALKIYYSGALSDGGNQPFPNNSLGNYRSSTEMINKKDATAPSTITGVTIDFASVACVTHCGATIFTGLFISGCLNMKSMALQRSTMLTQEKG